MKFFIVPLEKKFDSFGKIQVRQIYNGSALPTVGNNECWEKILSEFPYKITNLGVDEHEMDNSVYS